MIALGQYLTLRRAQNGVHLPDEQAQNHGLLAVLGALEHAHTLGATLCTKDDVLAWQADLADYLTTKTDDFEPQIMHAAKALGDDAYGVAHAVLPSAPWWLTAAKDAAHLPIVFADLDGTRYFWLARDFFAERALIYHVKRLSDANIAPVNANTDGLNDAQKQAALMASTQAFSIITGGPGTGKTHTLATFIAPLLRDGDAKIALTAPTGKAAQRVKESLQDKLNHLGVDGDVEAMTLHRFLQKQGYGVVVIDEASMMGMRLASKVFCAIATGTRVILLGDVDQLAAVEAGSVLSDLLALPFVYSTRLVQSQRFDDQSGVGKLARYVNEDDTPMPSIHCIDDLDEIIKDYQPYFCADYAKLPTTDLFKIVNHYRVLCVVHHGALGVAAINDKIKTAHCQHLGLSRVQEWYHGRLVMVTQNRYDINRYNGDVGVCVIDKDERVVIFEDGTRVSTALLTGSVVDSYAMTVHKSQGSEFECVAVLLSDAKNLSRQLVYTAITRAKKQVKIHGEKFLHIAKNTPATRQTGVGLMTEVVDFNNIDFSQI